jgi:hypothetical protein
MLPTSLNQALPTNFAVQANPVFNGSVPQEGPKIIPYPLLFVGNSSQEIDLTNYHQLGKFSGIQTVFIDNTANASAFTLLMAATNQVIECPPNSQGYFPVLITSTLRVTASLPISGTVQLIICNFAVAAAVWSGLGAATFPTFLFDSAGFLRVNSNNTPLTPTNKSGTITAGGVAQTIANANNTRTQIRIMNIDPTAETLWVRDDGASAVIGGAGSFPLAGGGASGLGGFFTSRSNALISVIAATTGHLYTATEDS